MLMDNNDVSVNQKCNNVNSDDDMENCPAVSLDFYIYK